MAYRRLRAWLTAAGLLAAACSGACSSGGSSNDSRPAPASGDPDDVFCDPVDAVADDEGTPATPTVAPLTRWVDPLIGTGGIGFSVGNTYPGPQAPYGMIKPSPDTSRRGEALDFSHCAGYAYEDDAIEAFSHARLLGAGIADYGGVALMPLTSFDASQAGPRRHRAPFSHATELASPGYYAVTLESTKIRVELTASARVAVHRYTFPAGAPQVVVVDAAHSLAGVAGVDDAELSVAGREISGSSHVAGSYSKRYGGFHLYFVVRFDRDPSSAGTYAGGVPSDVAEAKGADAGAVLRFDPASAVLHAHVALSFVDVAHARANLDAEAASFDETRRATEATWEKRLGRLRVDARSDRDRRTAYTALYHTALMPTLAMDVDGSYRGIDGQVHEAEGFRYYTDFSLWDTYRTLHPLVATLYPEDARDFAVSLTRMGQERGAVPRWPLGIGETGGMVGDGGAIALADTWMRGVRDWDGRAAYALLAEQATSERPAGRKVGRDALGDYLALGYVPNDRSSSAALTLEYAHADHAIGELARALGESADAERFLARGRNWQNVYVDHRFTFSGRGRDGRFDDVDPASMSDDFAEGSAWHYNFMVPHDIDGLADRMGRERFVARAEQLFTRAACNPRLIAFLPNPYYWPANEPVLFSGFAFSAVGDRDRTARWTRWTTITHFGDGPDGIPGNDDAGTMSAFYLFAALGFYPIAGTDRFVLGSPLFPRATLDLPSGTFVIEAPGASKRRRFPREITRNGAPIGNVLHQAELAGAVLRFQMETEPSEGARMPSGE